MVFYPWFFNSVRPELVEGASVAQDRPAEGHEAVPHQ